MMLRKHPSQDETASSPRPSLIRRLRDVTTELGWQRTLAIAPRWLVSCRYLVFVSDLRAPQPGSIPPAELRVTLLRDLDPAALAALTAAMVPDDAARRLREGQWCLLGWWGADLAHCRWESDRPTYLPYLARVVRPLPGDLLRSLDLDGAPIPRPGGRLGRDDGRRRTSPGGGVCPACLANCVVERAVARARAQGGGPPPRRNHRVPRVWTSAAMARHRRRPRRPGRKCRGAPRTGPSSRRERLSCDGILVG